MTKVDFAKVCFTKVYFIGAGPGDPELLTVKGQRIIREADLIIYAGSLVNPAVLAGHKEGALVYNSAGMNLEEILEVMVRGIREGKMVARVHTGDPSIYGAIREQMDGLDREGIPYEVVPGVSSFVGAAAALKMEYTLPGISQTVILTRHEGRTPVPEGQDLQSLARHKASMAIFLSVAMIEEVVAALLTGYTGDTPAAVIQKATWPDQKIVRGTLATIAAQVREAGIDRTALILVGDFLGNEYELSKLYDRAFSHGYRRASP